MGTSEEQNGGKRMRGRTKGQEGRALDQRGRNRNMKRRKEGKIRGVWVAQRVKKEELVGLNLYFSENLNLGYKDEVGTGV